MKNKKLLIILIIVTVILLSVAIVFTVMKNRNSNNNPNVALTDDSNKDNEPKSHTINFKNYEFSYTEPLFLTSYDDNTLNVTKGIDIDFDIIVEELNYDEISNSTKDILSTSENSIDILYSEYTENETNYIKGYVKKSDTEVWSFSGELTVDKTEIISIISEVFSNATLISNSQKIDTDVQNISFKIPEGFARFGTNENSSNESLTALDKMYYNYYYYLTDNSANQYTDVFITYYDKEALAYNYSEDNGKTFLTAYKTFDELLEENIKEHQDALDRGSYNTLDISDVQTLKVNNKDLKYFKVNYTSENENGIKATETIIALYPLNTPDNILKFTFTISKEGYNLDFETLKIFFEIEE